MFITTTLEAAAEAEALTVRQATRFLAQHGLTFEEAQADLGGAVLDAYELALWVGY
ncbi:MAG: hypothetical protein GY696_21285 [Gammaproteobacteria bacterium]|nr:hypothetical protein [Gammaproteobacteria bacterium]